MGNCYFCAGETVVKYEEVFDARTGRKFSVDFCPDCEVGITEPVPGNLADYYAGYYGGRHGFTGRFRARRRLRFVESASGKPGHESQVLDFGCGDGEFVRAAERNGWKAVGIELEEAPTGGSEVYTGCDELQKSYEFGAFDAITFWHSLEHLRKPDEALADARRFLRDEGKLIIAVPDSEGMQARVFRDRWLHLDCPRHLFHFGTDGLRKLLGKIGFEIETIRHMEFEYDLLGISQSALNRISSRPNLFFDTLRGKGDSQGPAKAGHFFGGVLLSAAALPFVFLGAAAKRGGTIVICATKSRSRNGT